MNLRHARRAQAGFTLIELMIVVVIIGILSAIAIPQYQAYTVRTQVTRAIAEAGALKTGIETCLLDGKTKVGKEDSDADDAQNCDPNATGSSILISVLNEKANQVGDTLPTGMGVPEALIGAEVTGTAPSDTKAATATITATFGNSAASYLKGTAADGSTSMRVLWIRSTNGTWSCGTSSAMDVKYAPPSCPPSTFADAPSK